MKKITRRLEDGRVIQYERKDVSRPRGTGSIYRRGNVWWYAFERDGVLIRESSRSRLKTVAQSKLEAAIKREDAGFQKTRASVKDLMDAAMAEYERQARRSLPGAKQRWKAHLEPVFANMQATRVTTEKLEEYAKARVSEGAAKATVNREMALLRFSFNLARKHRKLQFTPWFPMSRESNTRTGFLEDSQYDKLAAACAKRGLWLRSMFELAYQFGWRSGEIKSMRVRQVDLAAKTLRLDPQTTKNEEGREAVMPPVLFGLIEQCVTAKEPEDFVFTRERQQRTVIDFRAAWEQATKEAGVPDLLFHDLRRTAVRNMVRRGIPERVAMRITGHKTRAVFDRYHIVASTDLREAAAKMAQPLKLTVDSQEGSGVKNSLPN